MKLLIAKTTMEASIYVNIETLKREAITMKNSL